MPKNVPQKRGVESNQPLFSVTTDIVYLTSNPVTAVATV
jgi:hypothetical protein